MEATDTFDVVILGFEERAETPESRLTRAFGIGGSTAQQLVSRLPVTVQREVPRVRAEYFRRALTLIGARAEVRDQSGVLVPADPEPAQPAVTAPDATRFEAPEPAAWQPAAAWQHRGEAFAEPSPAPFDAAAGFGTTDRAPSPWHGDPSAVDPMSQTMAIAAAPQHMAAPEAWADAEVQLRAPANPTLREAAAVALPAAAAPAARPGLQPATVFDVTAPASGATPRKERVPGAMAATPTAFGGAVDAWGRPTPAPAGVAQAPAPALGKPAEPTVAAGAGKWEASGGLGQAAVKIPVQPASPAPAAAPARGRAAAAAASPGLPPLEQPGFDGPRDPSWAARMPSSVFDPPARAAPDAAMHAPRDPSSVFDPPAPAAAAPKQRAAAAPHAQSAPLPDFGFVSMNGSSQEGLALDLGVPAASIPRPAAPVTGGLPPLTLHGDPQASDLRVLSPWEQPSAKSMAEPSAKPKRARAPKPQAAEAGAAAGHGAAAAPAAAARANPKRPAAAAAKAAAPVGVADRRPSAQSLGNTDLRSFWASLVDGMVLPFMGPGLYWVGAITAMSVAVGLLGLLATAVPLLGAVVTFCANTCVLAFICDYYRVCLWASIAGDKAPDRGPEFDPARLLHSYVKSGIHLMLFIIVSQLLALAWLGYHVYADGLEGLLDAMLNPLTWLLLLVPYFYWPMGVAMTAVGNDFAAIWNVPAGLRAISRAPLEYTAVVGIGIATLFASAVIMAVFGGMLGIAGEIASSTMGLPLAISHGIQGALMGHLVRARPELFES